MIFACEGKNPAKTSLLLPFRTALASLRTVL